MTSTAEGPVSSNQTIDVAYLAAVLAAVSANPTLGHTELVRRLRETFPGRHITVCSEDEIPARLTPAAENAVSEIYFVASGGHCVSLTNDADAATGIVVALRGEDD